MSIPKFHLWPIAVSSLIALPVVGATCESLASLKLADTTITRAEISGKGTPPNGLESLPAFCRISATIAPTSDSEIQVEIWLPVSGWNGKYQAVGNGAFAGVINGAAMGAALERGYAASGTDTGHAGSGTSAAFALGHPEKVIDFAYRSEHEMVLKSKAVIEAFYGSPARYSYWNGCSTGGKQGLTEAQRYPGDFDGIIAGAPANYMTHLEAWSIWVNNAVHKTPDSFIPEAKYRVLHDAVMNACDALDGVKDGVLEDPRRCHFDPKAILCKKGDAPTCLTAPQVEAVKMLYSPAINPRTKKEVFPPLELGSELKWNSPIVPPGLAGPEPMGVAVDTFRYILFNDPNWDPMKLDLDKDVELADKIDNHTNNAIDPNLKPFFSHNGKLLIYHGWADQLIAPENSIHYYNNVTKELGGASKVTDSMRLFMVPGMNHCTGGDGPNSFDAVTLMEQWVEQGKAPEKMIASHSTKGVVDRTRPLCPYPQVAKYNGSGSTNEAANFSCKAP